MNFSGIVMAMMIFLMMTYSGFAIGLVIGATFLARVAIQKKLEVWFFVVCGTGFAIVGALSGIYFTTSVFFR